jgi:serine/threonine-protein kinase Chk2
MHASGQPKSLKGAPKQEKTPAGDRNPNEFMETGGKGDQQLYGYDGNSIYSKGQPADIAAER